VASQHDEPKPDGSSGAGGSLSIDDTLIAQRVEALVERGLDRYGTGDLRGAQSEWEHALALDPDNERARKFMSYVEENFDVLQARFRAGEAAGPEPDLGVPFGIDSVGQGEDDDDDDAYAMVELQIPGGDDEPELAEPAPSVGSESEPPARAETAEIDTNELPPVKPVSVSPLALGDSLDEGWVLDDYADALPPPPSKASAPDLEAELDSVSEGLLELGGTDPLDLAPNEDLSLGPSARGSGATSPQPSAAAPPETAPAQPAAMDGLDVLGDSPELDLRAEPDSLDLESLAPGPPLEETREFNSLELRSPDEDDSDEEKTIEVRRFAVREEDDDEITVPGSEPAPPFEPSLPLSSEAIAALSQPRHGTAASDETTAERSGARGLALRDLDALEGASPPDDRDMDFSPPMVTFRDTGTDLGDDEATRERRPADGLDDELTTERGAAHWSGKLGGNQAAPLDLEAAPGPPAVIVDQSLLEQPGPSVPDPSERPTREFDNDIQTRDLERQPISSPSLPGVGLTDEPVSVDALAASLRLEIDRNAPEGESDSDRTRRRVGALIKRAESEIHLGNHEIAITSLDLALDEDPDSAAAQKVIHRHRDLILQIYQTYLSDMSAIPMLAMPMHELPREQLDNRAAFLLSRIDGSLTFEEILDIAGMSQMEAYRYLCSMLVKGILEVR
jgi:hypothetical protein